MMTSVAMGTPCKMEAQVLVQLYIMEMARKNGPDPSHREEGYGTSLVPRPRLPEKERAWYPLFARNYLGHEGGGRGI